MSNRRRETNAQRIGISFYFRIFFFWNGNIHIIWNDAFPAITKTKGIEQWIYTLAPSTCWLYRMYALVFYWFPTTVMTNHKCSNTNMVRSLWLFSCPPLLLKGFWKSQVPGTSTPAYWKWGHDSSYHICH